MNQVDSVQQQRTGSVCLEEKVQKKRLHHPQDVVLKQTSVSPADVQQLLIIKEEVPDEWSSSLDQQNPELLHIKEEQEELWTSQKEEQLNGQEENVINRLTFTVKNDDDDEEKAQSSQLHQSQTEDDREETNNSVKQMKTDTDGEDCGEPKPVESPALNSNLQPNVDGKASDSSETDISDDDEDEEDDGWQEPLSDPGPETNSSHRRETICVR